MRESVQRFIRHQIFRSPLVHIYSYRRRFLIFLRYVTDMWGCEEPADGSDCVRSGITKYFVTASPMWLYGPGPLFNATIFKRRTIIVEVFLLSAFLRLGVLLGNYVTAHLSSLEEETRFQDPLLGFLRWVRQTWIKERGTTVKSNTVHLGVLIRKTFWWHVISSRFLSCSFLVYNLNWFWLTFSVVYVIMYVLWHYTFDKFIYPDL